MLKHLWKIILILVIIYLIVLISGESKGFDWKDFSYRNDEAIPETINIGFISSLTGPGALVGAQSLAAAQFAVDEINSRGGVDGRVIKLFAEDGKCSEQGGKEALDRLLQKDIVGLVGGLCSAETVGFIDTATENNILTISHCSSSTELSGISDYFFRVYPSDSFQGSYAAGYIKNDLGFDRIATMYLDDSWGNSLEEEFAKTFTSVGGEITSRNKFTADSDFAQIWDRITKEDVQLVYFLGFDETTPLALNLLPDNVDFVLFGADGWDDIEMWSRVNLGEKVIMYTVVDVEDYDPDFIEKMKERGVYSVPACVPQAYDALSILAKALALQNVNNSIDLLRDLKYQGVSGKNIYFDRNGDLLRSEYIVREVIPKREE